MFNLAPLLSATPSCAVISPPVLFWAATFFWLTELLSTSRLAPSCGMVQPFLLPIPLLKLLFVDWCCLTTFVFVLAKGSSLLLMLCLPHPLFLLCQCLLKNTCSLIPVLSCHTAPELSPLAPWFNLTVCKSQYNSSVLALLPSCIVVLLWALSPLALCQLLQLPLTYVVFLLSFSFSSLLVCLARGRATH